MTWWRDRDPGTFPPLWHQAIAKGPGTHVIQVYQTTAGIKGARKTWWVFMKSLREHPEHYTARAAEGLKFRTSQRWNPTARLYEFILTCRRSVIEDLTNFAEVFPSED